MRRHNRTPQPTPHPPLSGGQQRGITPPLRRGGREGFQWVRDNKREIAEAIILVFIFWAIWLLGFAGYLFLGGN